MTTLYGHFPLLLPNATESVSRYGLKKTSGTILFTSEQESSALALAEQNGGVFPAPQIRKTDSGLLEMNFDAYADTGQTSSVFGVEVLNLSKSFQATITEAVGNNPPAPIQYNWTINEVWLVDSYTVMKVLSARLPSLFLQVTTPALTKKLITRRIVGKRPSSGDRQLTLTWATDVTSVSRRNFGAFDEVDIVTSSTATVA